MNFKKLLFFTALVFSVNVSFAQKTIPDSVKLAELVVTGSKTEISRKVVPLSVSQISTSDIENSGQMNILPR